MVLFCLRVAVAKNGAPPRGPQRRMNCGGSFFVMFLAEIVSSALALRMAPIRDLKLSIRSSQSDHLNSVPVLRNIRLVIFVIFYTRLIYKLNLWS